MQAVRGHHEGSIWFHRGRRRWVATVSLPDGRRRSRFALTRAEAAEELRKLQVAATAPAIDASRIRLGDYLAQWASDDHGWAPATARKHASVVRTHLVPALGLIRLSELSVAAVDDAVRGRHVAPRTVSHIRATLRRALADAQRDGLLSRNVGGLSRPVNVPERERPVLTADQARALLDATRGTRYGPLWTVLVTTGLRISEALGLAWADVDLAAPAISVRYGLQRVNGEWVRRPPKTAKGRRTIPLTPLAVVALRAQRDLQAADRGAVVLDGLVFTTPTGNPIHATNLLPLLRKALAAAGLPKVGLHDLRHSCATILYAMGIPIEAIADILGHSTVRVTQDLYRHHVRAFSELAATKMQEAVGASLLPVLLTSRRGRRTE